jgi:glycolate oxidase iron-sulfur subunit
MRNLIRWITLRWLFMDQRRLQLAGLVLRLYQRLGFQSFLRRCGVLRLLPSRLRELEAMTPQVQKQFSADLIAPRMQARGTRKYRVALLTGCAQDLIFSDVNRDTAEVLARNGCEVVTPPEQSCCGSLHAHNGEWALAQELARRQIAQFPPEHFDAIITNAAGCGSHLKHYARLLAGESGLEKRARLWDERVKDVHEWLAEIGIARPSDNSAPAQVVTYHEACHLCHGQKITAQPREILRSIPNLTLVELSESTWCCGSAGIYNLIEPEMAEELLARKLKHIRATGASVVATANPGCLLQLLNGARRQNINLKVVHPMTLLAQAYRRE